MNAFEGGIRFVSRYRNEQLFPAGPPLKSIVNGQVVIDPRPLVQFENNLHHTEDPVAARALVENAMMFDQAQDYKLDAGCLPMAFREFWQHMSTATRRKVLLAFIDGASEEAAFDLIPSIETRAPEPAQDPGDAYQLSCISRGCKFVAKGQQAQQILAAHMLMTHRGAAQPIAAG